MKRRASVCRSALSGLTVVELLVVMAVLAILASLLMPALSRFKARALVFRARDEVDRLVSAVNHYESVYGRLPISTEARNGVLPLAEDYTYGSTFYCETGERLVIGGPGQYLNNNNEVIAILMDWERYPDGKATPNRDHVKNPKRIKFIELPPARDDKSSGVGPDGAYRDPWGITYLITLDQNNDGRARDAFYRNPLVSANPLDEERGLHGLVRGTDRHQKFVFEAKVPVIAWSPGPDTLINANKKATEAVNKDNLISWR